MPELTEPYVLGLGSDLERDFPELERQMTLAQTRAHAVDAELGQLLARLDGSKQALDDAQAEVARLTVQLGEQNLRIASLHQEMASFRRRADDLKAEMDRVGPGAIQRRLRRERAKQLVQVEDREAQVTALRTEAEAARDKLRQDEQWLTAEKDRSRAIVTELDRLQAELPDPYLFIRLFETQVGLAHCNYYLDRQAAPWRRQISGAIARMAELHGELRAGKYRLDKNSDIVGGRASATGEAVCGALVLGEREQALELFRVATDPSLYFHQIFNVFRVWSFGLWLEGRTAELRELLRQHRYEPGLRGAYVEAFLAISSADAALFARALTNVARLEWDGWQDATRIRGAGVVNLGALALARLAEERGMPVRLSLPTVPLELVRPGRAPAAAAGR